MKDEQREGMARSHQELEAARLLAGSGFGAQAKADYGFGSAASEEAEFAIEDAQQFVAAVASRIASQSGPGAT